MYLSFGILIDFSSSSISSDSFEDFGVLLILSTILFPMKSPVASAVFWIAFFEAVVSASVAYCLARS